MRRAVLLLAVLVAACAPVEAPRKLAELPGGTLPLHLIVSNQSFDTDPVDIDVFVDDVHVIAGDFEVGSQHTYLEFDFLAAPGPHTVRLAGDEGRVTLERDFRVDAETWGIAMFWYYARTEAGHQAQPAQFTWSVQDTAPAFD